MVASAFLWPSTRFNLLPSCICLPLIHRDTSCTTSGTRAAGTAASATAAEPDAPEQQTPTDCMPMAASEAEQPGDYMFGLWLHCQCYCNVLIYSFYILLHPDRSLSSLRQLFPLQMGTPSSKRTSAMRSMSALLLMRRQMPQKPAKHPSSFLLPTSLLRHFARTSLR